jgi:hypothetical protein
MTIPSTVSEVSHAGDGVSLAFPIPFVFDSAADLKVTRTDSLGNVGVLTTGFVISGGAGATGTITFSVAPAADVDIAIYDNPEIKQATDYVSNDPFPAESHERALDRLTRIAKRLARQFGRTLHLNDGDPITDLTLGSVDNRKGKYLFFNVVTGAIEYAVNLVTTPLSQSIIGVLLWPQTQAEAAAGVVPTRYFPPGDIRRLCIADGIADDTVALNKMAAAALYAYSHPNTGPQFIKFTGGARCLTSATVDFSGIEVRGYGGHVHIQASAAQFDVIKTVGDTTLIGLRVDGGGTGLAGQLGDIVSAKAIAPAFPYVLRNFYCIFTNAKRDVFHIERGGYTSFWHCRSLGFGRNGLSSEGTDLGANATTTVETGGACQWGGGPNGYGINLAYAANHRLRGDIIEAVGGGAAIKVGGDNRSLSLHGVYAESTGALFVDWAGSSGIGISFVGCFGGNTRVDYNANWQIPGGYGHGNSNLSLPALPPSSIIIGGAGEIQTSTTGGVTLNSGNAQFPPGSYQITATLVTVDSVAATLTDLGFVLYERNIGDPVSTASGATSTTANGALIKEAARKTGANITSIARIEKTFLYHNRSTLTKVLDMRSYVNIAAGTLGTNGYFEAFRL